MSMLLFGSMTASQRAKRALARIGISATIKKVDSRINNGCSYALSFEEKHYLNAIAEIRRMGISYFTGA